MEKECYSAFSRGESAFNLLLGFLVLTHPLKLSVQVLDGFPEDQQFAVRQSPYASHLSLKLSQGLHVLASSWHYCFLSPCPYWYV